MAPTIAPSRANTGDRYTISKELSLGRLKRRPGDFAGGIAVIVVVDAEDKLVPDWGEAVDKAVLGGAEVIAGRGVEESRLEEEPTAAYIEVNASVGVGTAAAGLALGLPHSL